MILVGHHMPAIVHNIWGPSNVGWGRCLSQLHVQNLKQFQFQGLHTFQASLTTMLSPPVKSWNLLPQV
jgi:hypothetical protein